ncbi:hypothetical protein D3C73_706150 [compost metagenome]
MAEWCGIRLLGACIHVSFVVVLYNNHLVAAQCCTDSRAHTDVHPAVTSNHDKGEVFLQAKSIQLTAAFAFPEHFHDTGQRSCTVLEQVVDERRFMC